MPKNIFKGDLIKEPGTVLTEDELSRLSIYGDGSDGSYTSGDNLTPGKVYNFTDFVLNSGDTLTSTVSNSGEPIIVKVKGDVDISGTIDLNQKGYAGGKGYSSMRVNSDGSFDIVYTSGTGSAGGDAITKFNAGQSVFGGRGGVRYNKNDVMSLATGNILPFSGTGGGSAGQADDDDRDREFGGGGGGASYDARGGQGGNKQPQSGGGGNGSGGDGGGSMIIICSRDFGFSGEIDIRGQSGGGGAAGGGGGAGGMFYGVYRGALTDSGTKLTSGGSGGNGSVVNGGNGANGTVLFESVS